jgi:thymidylate synthase ThyX
MDRPAAIAQIREACKNIALQFMKIHPAVPGLADEETQKECFRCVHEMTVLLEKIKKKISRLERADEFPPSTHGVVSPSKENVPTKR